MNIQIFTGGAFQTNGYLFSQDGHSLLFDAPEGVCQWLVDLGITPDGLLLTHLHYDHVVDVADIKEKFSCPVWSHSEPNPDLTLESALRQMAGFDFQIAPFTIDHLLAGADSVQVGEIPIDILHVPGHSPDSLCFLPHRESEEADAEVERASPFLIGGDVLFRGGIGRTDFSHGDHDLLIEGIREKLYSLADETLVYPGHGPATSIGEEKASNPFVRG